MQLSPQAFRRHVDEALARVPAELQPYLEGVAIRVEDWAPEELLRSLGVPEGDTLYGLYSGRSLLQGPPASGDLPPQITIYRGPLLEACADEEALRREIATTVLHEIAHHFGIGEARLEELGWG